MISVIMPVYNTTQYIDESIFSVLNQTYKDFELIIVDDGSNQETKELLKVYEVRDNIKLVTLDKNYGIGYARNKGIENASYDLIAFLSSDDTWEKNFLDMMVKSYEGGILFSNYDFINEKSEVINNFDLPIVEDINKEIMNWALSNNMFTNYSALLGEKKYFEGKFKFLEDLRYGEDLHHILITSMNGIKIEILNYSLVHYRLHNGQTTKKICGHIAKNNEKIFKRLGI